MCDGRESSISSCRFNGWNIHDCKTDEAAGVICRVRFDQPQQPLWPIPIPKPTLMVNRQMKILDLPDLEPDPKEVEKSAYIESRSIMYLQCAMEENCLSQSAYEIDKNDPSKWMMIIFF